MQSTVITAEKIGTKDKTKVQNKKMMVGQPVKLFWWTKPAYAHALVLPWVMNTFYQKVQVADKEFSTEWNFLAFSSTVPDVKLNGSSTLFHSSSRVSGTFCKAPGRKVLPPGWGRALSASK